MTALFCQVLDTVYLKDGTTLHGTINLFEDGKYVVITLPDGTTKLFYWDVVASINKQSTSAIPSSQSKAAIQGSTDIRDVKDIPYNRNLTNDELHQYWKKQSGALFYWDLVANYDATKRDIKVADNNSATGVTKVNYKGNGFGFNGSICWLYFNGPDKTTHKIWSVAPRVGISYAMNVNMFDIPGNLNPPAGIPKVIDHVLSANIDAGLIIGAQVGLGTFPLPQKWANVTAGFAWRPVFRFTSDPTEVKGASGKSSTQIVTSSMEYSLNFGSVKALSGAMGSRNSFKINLIIDPPTGKYNMTMWMVGIGVGNYQSHSLLYKNRYND